MVGYVKFDFLYGNKVGKVYFLLLVIFVKFVKFCVRGNIYGCWDKKLFLFIFGIVVFKLIVLKFWNWNWFIFIEL